MAETLTNKTSTEVIVDLTESWFSQYKSNEDVMGGVLNGDYVLKSLSTMVFIVNCVKIGLLCKIYEPVVDCSADGPWQKSCVIQTMER